MPPSGDGESRIWCLGENRTTEWPGYFALDAEINRSGAAPLAELEPPPGLSPRELEARSQAGALVLDTRPAAQFGAGHIPGAVHIGLVGQYASWAGRLIGLDREIVLVAEDHGEAAGREDKARPKDSVAAA